MGSTGDFVDDTPALFIDSQRKPKVAGGVYLEPILDHLIELMLQAKHDEPWRRAASAAGVSNACTNFNWDTVVDKMLTAIFDPEPS